jgi:lipid-binding SYLF domain-containing protein
MRSIQRLLQNALLVSLALATVGVPAPATGSDDDTAAIKKAGAAVDMFKKTDPSLDKFFKNAKGWAVFPSVGKGAIGIGGAGGSGILFEKGKAVGKTSLTQVTVGLALGGQSFSEIIFFENDLALSRFKGGDFALAAQVSAVAAASGAAAAAKYTQGVAVFTAGESGLMFEASVGGQGFGFTPFGEKKK